MSDDDWRVHVTFKSDEVGSALNSALERGEGDPGLAGHGVIVSHQGLHDEMFLYAGTRQYAERAQHAVEAIGAQHGLELKTEVRQWHPVAEQWVPADVPLPDSPAAVAAERSDVNAAEDRDSARLGQDAFLVRIACGSRREAQELAAKLAGDGIDTVHRWNYLITGAPDEDAATALAERIRRDVPGVHVSTEASWAETNRVVSGMEVHLSLLPGRAQTPETL